MQAWVGITWSDSPPCATLTRNTSVAVFSQMNGHMMEVDVEPFNTVLEVKHMILNAYVWQTTKPECQYALDDDFRWLAGALTLEKYGRQSHDMRRFDDDDDIVDDVDSDWFFCMYYKRAVECEQCCSLVRVSFDNPP